MWRWKTPGAAREIFQDRAMKAGFPRGMFGFHSLRAGFLCSAILKDGNSKESIEGIMEHTAIVAGW